MNQIFTAYARYVAECRASLPCSIRAQNFGLWAGLLDIHSETYANLNNYDWLKAYLCREIRTGRLLIHFDRSALSLRNENRLFPQGYLRIRHQGTLSSDLAMKLKLPSYWMAIQPGRYPLLDGPDFLTASVPLCSASSI